MTKNKNIWQNERKRGKYKKVKKTKTKQQRNAREKAKTIQEPLKNEK